MKAHWYKYIVYASLVFLVITLIAKDFLFIPDIKNYNSLIISFVLLFTAFLLLAMRWFYLLQKNEMKVSFLQALKSVGISIFAKYIPGKLFVILGKAAYINKAYNYPNKKLISISLSDQLIAIWSGVLIGIPAMQFIENKLWFIGMLALWLLLSLFIFTKKPHQLIEGIFKKIRKKELNIPVVSLKSTFGSLFIHFAYWVIISTAYYFLIESLVIDKQSIAIGYSFPLAVVLGIISLFAPGGFGVREGLLTTFLLLSGMEIELATSIAVVSRLWFLCGELFIFISSLFIKNNS